MKFLRVFLILTLSIALFLSCRKETPIEEVEEFTEEEISEPIVTPFFGRSV